jgi:hypothetical protein
LVYRRYVATAFVSQADDKRPSLSKPEPPFEVALGSQGATTMFCFTSNPGEEKSYAE